MPTERTKHFKRVRVEMLAHFDRRSMRITVRGSHRIITGCPRGHWDNEAKECKAPTRAQSILHPLDEHNPCVPCDRVRMGLRF